MSPAKRTKPESHDPLKTLPRFRKRTILILKVSIRISTAIRNFPKGRENVQADDVEMEQAGFRAAPHRR
jgi:hypothetical protein